MVNIGALGASDSRFESECPENWYKGQRSFSPSLNLGTPTHWSMKNTKKILLIEDDPFISDVYITNLKNSGFEVLLASDGESGLNLAKQEKFDLILLDLLLPKIDGFEILKNIKGETTLKNVPVIILTNLGEKENIEKGKRLGAVDYLVKINFTPKEVIEKLNTYLK